MKWGIYDTQTKNWMGTHSGPFLFQMKIFAEVRAAIINKQAGTESRFEAKEFNEDMSKGRLYGEIKLSKLKAENQKRG